MPAHRLAPLGLLIVAVLAACGSGGDSSGIGTHLEVDGVATTGAALSQPDASDPDPPVPDPSDAPEVDISGTVSCDGAPTGTGLFETTAVQVCADLSVHAGDFEEIERTGGQVCAEVYGGPQHASISGAIAGQSVDVSIDRTDACGIQSWQSLEWLLGPPER